MKKSTSVPAHTLSFTDWLGELSDEELAQLLALRPDVVLPLPPGIVPLAARLQLRASISRAVQHLDVSQLVAMESFYHCEAETTPVGAPAAYAVLAQRCAEAEIDAPAEATFSEAVTDLVQRGLLFGTRKYRLVKDAMSVLPAGWQLLPDSQAGTVSAEDVAKKLIDLPARKRKILDTLRASGGLGITKDAALDADPRRPIPELIADGLLIRVDASTVKLPQKVRSALHGVKPLPLVLPDIPFAPFSNDAAVAAGLDVLRQLRLLLTALSDSPASTLKGGEIGVRELGRLSTASGLDRGDVARLLGLAASSGLIAKGVPEPLPRDDDGGDYYAPTSLADAWLSSPLGEQWSALLEGWRRNPWDSSAVGTKDEKGTTIHPFSPSTHSSHRAVHRGLLMEQWKKHGDLSEDALSVAVRFAHPLAPLTATEIISLVSEAHWVGALSSVLLGDDPQSLMPEATDRLIVQGDMTILAPGPLTPRAQTLVDVIATLESSGVASVYRVTEHSLRHAFDLGWNQSDIMSALSEHALTEIPSALKFMVEDVSRRHGSLRGGPALSYLRCDDPSILVHAVSAVGEKVAMRTIAPTVAVAQAPLIDVIRELREAGLQPVAEDASGMRLDLIDEPSRVPADTPPSPSVTLDEGRIAAAVAAIRRNDAQPEKAKRSGTAVPASETLATLQTAAKAGRTVTLGFVDKQGVAVQRVVRPLSVSAGVVDAVDPATGSAHRFRLHRITEVRVD